MPKDKMQSSNITPLPFETVPPPGHGDRLGKWTIVLGITLMVVGLVAPTLGAYIPAGFDPTATAPVDTLFFWMLAVPGIIGLFFGVKLIGWGRQMRALPAVERLQEDPRSPVLFLRSFEDDDLVDPTPRMVPMGDLFPRRYEESLSGPLKRVGPMISIGRPGNRLAMLGGARLFVPDHAWQGAVEHLRTHAAAVVLMVGRTGGLWWELTSSIAAVPRERLLFFFPYVEESKRRKSIWQRIFHYRPAQLPFSRKAFERMERERQARYLMFRDRVQPLLSDGLPETLGNSLFIDFAADGTLRVLPTVRPWWSPVAFYLPSLSRMLIDVQRTLRPFVVKLT